MKVLVVGAAHCLGADLEMVGADQFDAVMAVNRAAVFYPGELHHIVSYHAEILDALRDERRLLGLPGEPVTHSYRNYPGVDVVWSFGAPALGYSGLYALKIATLGMRAKHVVLAGCPMLEGMGYYGGPAETDYPIAAENYTAWRRFHRDCLRGDEAPIVRSCSGWTAHLLGAYEPTI